MISTAWKFAEEGDGIIYSLQIDEVPWKYKKALFKAMSDWKAVSVGWHKQSGNQIFIFKKKFHSQEDWTKWANSFPLEIKEKRYWGDKERTITHGKKAKNG